MRKKDSGGPTHSSNDFRFFCRQWATSEVLNYHKSLECLWANLPLISSPYHNSSLENFAFSLVYFRWLMPFLSELFQNTFISKRIHHSIQICSLIDPPGNSLLPLFLLLLTWNSFLQIICFRIAILFFARLNSQLLESRIYHVSWIMNRPIVWSIHFSLPPTAAPFTSPTLPFASFLLKKCLLNTECEVVRVSRVSRFLAWGLNENCSFSLLLWNVWIKC